MTVSMPTIGPLRLTCFLLFFPCLLVAASSPAQEHVRDWLSIPAKAAPSLLPAVSLWFVKTTALLIAHIVLYVGMCSALEGTHPNRGSVRRQKHVPEQKRLSLIGMFWNVTLVSLYMAVIEPYFHPYYNYYDNPKHPFTLRAFLISAAVYAFIFDAWFYWSHRIFHHPWLWRRVHWIHHQYTGRPLCPHTAQHSTPTAMTTRSHNARSLLAHASALYCVLCSEPTAFAQDAVHPLEAVVQGCVQHLLPSFFYPQHPIALALFGLANFVQAILAHDGRVDYMSHQRHHTHRDVNFGVLWPFWDVLCGTRFTEATPEDKSPAGWGGAAEKAVEKKSRAVRTQVHADE